MKTKLVISTIFLSALFVSQVEAKTMINLYDEPKAGAKVIGTIDVDKGIIPIFTAKDNQWTKAGDPENGNVGWVKQSDMKSTGAAVLTCMFSSGNGSQGYQMMQFTAPKSLTPEQTQAIQKEIQIRQQAAKKMMEDMQKEMKTLYQRTNLSGFPIIMPVLVVPQEKSAPASKTNKTN